MNDLLREGKSLFGAADRYPHEGCRQIATARRMGMCGVAGAVWLSTLGLRSSDEKARDGQD